MVIETVQVAKERLGGKIVYGCGELEAKRRGFTSCLEEVIVMEGVE